MERHPFAKAALKLIKGCKNIGKSAYSDSMDSPPSRAFPDDWPEDIFPRFFPPPGPKRSRFCLLYKRFLLMDELRGLVGCEMGFWKAWRQLSEKLLTITCHKETKKYFTCCYYIFHIFDLIGSYCIEAKHNSLETRSLMLTKM